MVQGNKAALARHSQCKQVNIRDLVVPEHAVPVDTGFCSQRHLIRPKLVVKISADLLELVLDRLKSCRPKSAVARQIENADHPVFNDWASGNLDLAPLRKRQGLGVVNVCLIEQCDPYIDIQ